MIKDFIVMLLYTFFRKDFILIHFNTMKLEEGHKKSKYNGFETKGKNFIWAGAMCLAW